MSGAVHRRRDGLRIENNPKAFAVIYRDVRRAILKDFPYGDYFRIEANQCPVFVVTQFARDPKAWQSRP